MRLDDLARSLGHAADVDDFKRYNYSRGHPAGDCALRAIAAVLAAALRRGDALFRIGGDEFAAVLPDVDARSRWRSPAACTTPSPTRASG